MLKAALERGLEAELTEHVGYERGAVEASLHENSRNGMSRKTVGTEIGDVELGIPRDRNGTFTPMLVPKGQRRLDGRWHDHLALCRWHDAAWYPAPSCLHDRYRDQPRDDLEDRRPDWRGDPDLAAAAAGGALSGDLP